MINSLELAVEAPTLVLEKILTKRLLPQATSCTTADVGDDELTSTVVPL